MPSIRPPLCRKPCVSGRPITKIPVWWHQRIMKKKRKKKRKPPDRKLCRLPKRHIVSQHNGVSVQSLSCTLRYCIAVMFEEFEGTLNCTPVMPKRSFWDGYIHYTLHPRRNSSGALNSIIKKQNFYEKCLPQEKKKFCWVEKNSTKFFGSIH